jgi:predicted nucleic acid-binding protein
MAVKVVDASALAALLFGEPEAEAIAMRLEGSRLIAPTLLGFEITNTCLKKLRRDPQQRDALLIAFARYFRMPIEMVEVGHPETLQLAEGFGLTGYDAAYLWLARQLTAELVTLDRWLQAATGQRH